MRTQGYLRKIFDQYVALRQRRKLRLRQHTQTFDALRGSVTIDTSTFGVSHIQAKHTEDLFFTQGYITARDRLFQMDYDRHAARGRICELVGLRQLPWRQLTVHIKDMSTLDVDIMLRTFGLEQVAQASFDITTPAAKSILEAYAAGVNAYIDQGERTLEHRLLGVTPEPWTPVDSLVLSKAMGFQLNYAWRSILIGDMLHRALPMDVAQMLWPHFPAGGSTIVADNEHIQELSRQASASYTAASHVLGSHDGPGAGSNCWAVDAAHSATGKAIIANDTHLALTAPVAWHEVHLTGAGFELEGFALSGLPGIGIGRNAHGCWGITAGLVQDLDLFLEKRDPTSPRRYATPDGWKKFKQRQEIFNIKGASSQTRTIEASHHGPLLPTMPTQPPGPYDLSLCWTGHQPASDLDTLLRMWQSDSLDSFTEATQSFMCPTFNMMYAGDDGRIGYVLTGRIPKRKKDAPLRPLEGWTGRWDWEGFVPFDENPRNLEPASGLLVTANNRVAPWRYPHELGTLFEPPHRFDRITEVLSKKLTQGALTFEDMSALQSDTYSRWGLQVRDAMLSVSGGIEGLITLPQSHERSAAELLRDWDGVAATDSPGATLLYVTANLFGKYLVQALVDEDSAMGFIEMSSFVGASLLEALGAQERLSKPDVGVDVADIVRQSFGAAVATCEQQLGTDLRQWRWGDMHPLWSPHRFGHRGLLGALLSIGPEPAAGGPHTVNRADMNINESWRLRVGPAMRMVVEAGPTGRMETIMPGGQSGDRLSPHYDDQLEYFLTAKLKPAHTPSASSISHERFEP